MLYRRAAWERRPFDPSLNVGEDLVFSRGLYRRGISSQMALSPRSPADWEPRMVARLHPGNTSGTDPEKLAANNQWLELKLPRTIDYVKAALGER